MLRFTEFARALRYATKNKTSLRTEYDADGVLWFVVTPFKSEN